MNNNTIHTKLARIVFQSGTHGHFLIYFLDRFSSLTPDIKELPFTDNGTSHAHVTYSHKFGSIHPPIKKFEDDVPLINITISQDDIPLLFRFTHIRTSDFKINLNEDHLTDFQINKLGWGEKLKTMYKIKNDIIPRCVKRDLYKMTYLDPTSNEYFKLDQDTRKKLPKNSICISVSDFWEKEKFKKAILYIDQQLDLKLKNIDWSVYDEFIKRVQFIDTRHRVYDVIESIKNDKDMDITDLDVVEEAYISAYIEKNYDFIAVPFTNNFFNNTKEIAQWLKIYPEHYKAMNPNLPTFNGIPNPFYLWNLKK